MKALVERETGLAKANEALEWLALQWEQWLVVRFRVRQFFLHLRRLGLRVIAVTRDLTKPGLYLPWPRAQPGLLAVAEQDQILDEGKPGRQVVGRARLRIEERSRDPKPLRKRVLDKARRQLGIDGFSVPIDLFLNVLQRGRRVVFLLDLAQDGAFSLPDGPVRVQSGSLVGVVDGLPLGLVNELEIGTNLAEQFVSPGT